MGCMRYMLIALLAGLVSGCYLEVGGCSGNVCFAVSEQTCDGHHCATPSLRCENPQSIRQRMAEIVSEARAQARRCGASSFPQADRVYWNDQLADAAQRHADDMARHNFLSHTGSDGSTAWQRAEEAGYEPRRLLENIGGGDETASAIMNAWLGSPDHCANLMDNRVTDIGAACVHDPRSDFQTYWSLLLATDDQ